MTVPISTDMLGAFVKVAEHLSVSRAAVDLGVGKGVVSKRVAQLEAAVKATLFSRSTRQVALTSAGAAYLDFARRALREVDAAEERLRDLRVELSGPIRVTAPVSWGQCVLAPRLPGFLHLHPGISVELHLVDRMMDLGREGIDVALRWTCLPAPDLHAQVVAQVGWLLAASPGYLAEAGAAPAEPEDLAGHPCMGYWRESADDAWALARGHECRRVRVSGRYHVNNPESVTAAALGGLGIGLLPDYLCAAALADGRLLRVLPAWTPQTPFGTRITAFVPPERLRLARNLALLAFLARALAVPASA